MSKFDLPDIFNEAKGSGGNTGSFMKDALKNITDIDTDQVKKDWEDVSNGNSQSMANGYLQVIADTADKASAPITGISKWLKSKSVDNRSIIARAKNSIIQFPIFVSQSIRANEAHIMSQMFERVYASFVQAAIAQNPLIDEGDVQNMKFLDKFHSNIKEAAEQMVNAYYEPIDETDAMMKESIFFKQQLTENCEVIFRKCIVNDSYFLAENTRLLNEPCAGFPYLLMEAGPSDDQLNKLQKNASINRKIDEAEVGLRKNEQIEYTRSEKPVSNDDIIDIVSTMYHKKSDDSQNGISEKDVKLYKMSKSEVEREAKADAERYYADEPDSKTDYIASKLDEKDSVDETVDKYIRKFKNNVINAGSNGYQGYFYKNGRIIRINNDRKVVEKKNPGYVDKPVDLPQFLKDNEIKKINAASPFMMSATFRVKLSDGHYDRDVKFIIGIKSVLHLINPKDLASDLQEIVTGKIKSLQKVRYKTGEISFKDYLFNPEGLKKDAARRIQYNKRWLNTLKRLSDTRELNGTVFNNSNKLLNSGKTPIPNGTLILSQADVSALAGETGIDLSVANNAIRLAHNLFLIAVVIVDASAGTMKILYPDMNNTWEIQSISSIEADIAKSDNSSLTRELMRAVNR